MPSQAGAPRGRRQPESATTDPPYTMGFAVLRQATLASLGWRARWGYDLAASIGSRCGARTSPWGQGISAGILGPERPVEMVKHDLLLVCTYSASGGAHSAASPVPAGHRTPAALPSLENCQIADRRALPEYTCVPVICAGLDSLASADLSAAQARDHSVRAFSQVPAFAVPACENGVRCLPLVRPFHLFEHADDPGSQGLNIVGSLDAGTERLSNRLPFLRRLGEQRRQLIR